MLSEISCVPECHVGIDDADDQFQARARTVLMDVFGNSLDEPVIDFLCESLSADVNLQENVGPFLLDVGVASEASLASTCSTIAARLGINSTHVCQAATSNVESLTQELCAAVRVHQETFVECRRHEVVVDIMPTVPVEPASCMMPEKQDISLWFEEHPQVLAPWSEFMFANYHLELQSSIQESAPEELAAVIRVMADIAGASKARSIVLGKLADVVEDCELGGPLVFAGGEKLLQERVSPKLRRSEASVAIHASRDVMTVLRKIGEAGMDGGYWSRLEMGSEEDLNMVTAFAGSPVEGMLRRALQPRSRNEVAYSLHECRYADVAHAHHVVQQALGSSPGPHLRVACVIWSEQPGQVRQNLVLCNEAGRWLLLCSVDFAQHGSAPSGHWHLNLTPGRDQVEHWGPRGSVFHGSWHCCPLWWLVIPDGMQHLQTPLRLKAQIGQRYASR